MRVLLFLLFLTVTASAQTPDAPVLVSAGGILAPWMPLILEVCSLIITILGTIVTWWLKKHFDIKLDESRMLTLQTALTNAAGVIVQKYGPNLNALTLDVRSEAIRDAILYVNGSAAKDAVEHFGLNEDQIATKVLAKLGVITAPQVLLPTAGPIIGSK